MEDIKDVDNGNNHEKVNFEEREEERLFTQSEVNEIIKRRLERNKAANAEHEEAIASLEERERQLNELQDKMAKRESLINCKAYLQEKGYPLDLVDIIETSDFDTFRDKADKAVKMSNITNIAPLGSNEPTITGGSIPEGFAFGYKHKPKDYGVIESK